MAVGQEIRQEIALDESELMLQILNINSAYRLGLIKTSDVVRLLKMLCGENNVP